MRVVFASLPAYGHLYPLMPLALACAEAGHDVVVAAGPPFTGRLPLPTVTELPEDLNLHTAQQRAAAIEMDPSKPLPFPVALFGEILAVAVRDVLLPQWRADRPDLVVYESSNVGAGLAAQQLEIPAVSFATGQWGEFRVKLFQHVGLPLPVLLDPLPPTWRESFEPSPARRIDIRTTPWSETSATPPTWLNTDSGRPRAYLTLGTVAFGAVEVLRRAIIETTQAGFDVLAAVGPDGDPSLLGQLPDSVHVERFVAQQLVLPHVDLVVHHGGTGTILGAFAAGVPQIVIPQGADQFVNATRMTHVGAGRVVHNNDPGGAITDAAHRILHCTAERDAAQRLHTEIAAMPSPSDVAGRLHQLIG
jgi:UDP:flavonoid glycosyltransferase YjiC (YdhE family)